MPVLTGRAVFQPDEAAQAIVVLDELLHQEDRRFKQFLAVIAEEEAVILPAPLRVSHQPHCRSCTG